MNVMRSLSECVCWALANDVMFVRMRRFGWQVTRNRLEKTKGNREFEKKITLNHCISFRFLLNINFFIGK